mmetsp:Transcript_11230/g.69359  ORF Transcript_11230/g.69359 Transcript_11230/m.69359 type:complete len:90 (+) Transcript_11230:143-412(+)
MMRWWKMSTLAEGEHHVNWNPAAHFRALAASHGSIPPIREGMHPQYGPSLGGVLHAVCKLEIKADNMCECVLFMAERIGSEDNCRMSHT